MDKTPGFIDVLWETVKICDMVLGSRLRNIRILMPTWMAQGTDVSALINDISSIRGPLERYLEIGVEYGKTLEAVKANYRVAIDPHFRFNRYLKHRRTQLFEVKSDDYFQNYWPQKIDIAFIDGLHTGEQTYFDFVNLLPYLSEDSLVIVDDVIPSDIHSSLPTAEEAYASRTSAGIINDFKWHGDVYNAITAINSQFPTLKYFTISDLENPVTIFYNFNAYTKNSKNFFYSVNINNSKFLKDDPITIPKNFNPISRDNFLREIFKYFKNS